MNLGRSIKHLRVKNGMNQQSMADALGVSKNYISMLENGDTSKKRPSITLIEKIADVFKVPPAVIFWFGIEEEDIQPEKLYAFRKSQGLVDAVLNDVFYSYE